jgi:hypothetical protein
MLWVQLAVWDRFSLPKVPQSFLVVTSALNTALIFFALLLFHRWGFNYVPPGPITIVFSVIYQYYRIVPPTYHFRLSAVSISNKAPMYFLGLTVSLFFIIIYY